EEIPPWLDSKYTIPYYKAFLIPGVIEFSAAIFFCRMVSFFFLFWRPAFLLEGGYKTLDEIALYNLPYIIGGFIGGVLIGVLKDIFQKNALVCISFQVLSIPAIALQTAEFRGENKALDIFLQMILGLFVEAPVILLSTSVSVELGTHSILRRGHRGLATIASIVEGSGALGATIGPLIITAMTSTSKWNINMIYMIVVEIIGAVCLSRMAYKDYLATSKKLTFGDYWMKGASAKFQQ
ncbi:glucose-6-phosphate exchanger SLC37A2, partial [Nephila pilipes]